MWTNVKTEVLVGVFRLAAGNTGRFMLVYPAAADALCAAGPGASLVVAL